MDSCYLGDKCNEFYYSSCKDSVTADFSLSDAAKSWWFIDSIGTNYIKFRNQLGAELDFYRKSTSTYLAKVYDTYTYYPPDCDNVQNCDISVSYKSYNTLYFDSKYNFQIKVELDRIIPNNTNNLESSNWLENLVFTNKFTELRFAPDILNTNFNTYEKISSLNISDTIFNNVIHVFDTSLMSKNTLEIVGYYFTPKDGIIRYYLNNNDVWTIE